MRTATRADSAEADLVALRAERDAARQSETQLKGELTRLEAERDTLQQHLEAMREGIAAWRADNEIHVQAWRDAEAQLTALRSRGQALVQQLTEIREDLRYATRTVYNDSDALVERAEEAATKVNACAAALSAALQEHA